MRLTSETHQKIKQVFIILTCLYIMSGGFYNQIIEPGSIVVWNKKYYTISPDMNEQTNRESLLAFICNLTTYTGLITMYHSKGRTRLTANRLMILGIALLLAGLIGSYSLIEAKKLPWYQ